MLDDDGATVGRILQVESGPAAGIWRWSITAVAPPDGTLHGSAPTLDEAKEALRSAWDRHAHLPRIGRR